MAESVGNKIFKDFFPSNTSICDFAYPNSNPLRKGEFICIDLDYDLGDLEYEGFMSNAQISNEYDEIEHDSPDEINKQAVALFDFVPENDNEVALKEGQIIWISYRHGQGWLVAEDPESGENGLVPEEYVDIYYETSDNVEIEPNVEEVNLADDVPKPFLPEILQDHDQLESSLETSDSEWVDTDTDADADERSEGSTYLPTKKISHMDSSSTDLNDNANSQPSVLQDKVQHLSIT